MGDRYHVNGSYYRTVSEDGTKSVFFPLSEHDALSFGSSLDKGVVVFMEAPYRITCWTSESDHYTYEDTLDLTVFYDLERITWKEYNKLSKKADKQRKAAAKAYRSREFSYKLNAALDRIRWTKTLSETKTFWIICGLWVVFEAIAITVCVVFGLPPGVGLGEEILTSLGAATMLVSIIYLILKGLGLFN